MHTFRSWRSAGLLYTAALLLLSTVSLCDSATRVQLEHQLPPRDDWQQIGPAPPSTRIALLFAVKHTAAQLADLHALATAVSTPGDPNFRKYVSLEQMNDRFTPPAGAQQTVVDFLQSELEVKLRAAGANLNASSSDEPIITIPAPGFVRVSHITVAKAATLLHTDFQLYEKAARGAAADPYSVHAVDHSADTSFIRASGYSLPAKVAAAVDFVGGCTKLPGRHFSAVVIEARLQPVQADSFSPNASATAAPVRTNHLHYTKSQEQVDTSYVVTPRFLREAYSMPSNVRGPGLKPEVEPSREVKQMTPAFLEQYFDPFDLELFLTQNQIHPVGKISKVVGPNNPSSPGGEASLDVQLLMSMAPGVPTELWSFPGRRDNTRPPSNLNQEPFLDWLVMLAATPFPPLVHSVSYADDEKDCTPQYMARIDVEFQKAATRGVTILFASGDDGVGSVDVREKPGSCTKAQPTFPSSSPWVISIGGTQLAPRANRRGPGGGHANGDPFDDVGPVRSRAEITCSSATGCIVTTGGGFSDFFSRPAWQTPDMSPYLKRSAGPDLANTVDAVLYSPPGWFNRSGRGYPDLAAIATNYEIFLGGRATRIGGTSASTPVIAAMLSLLNTILIGKGEAPLGFAAPWLYMLAWTHPSTFTDIAQGNNACSQVASLCCDYGFAATPGWDAVTGVGTPRFSEIMRFL